MRGAREGVSRIFTMRTTLKRGVGRAAPVDGNGRGRRPPTALTPIARYEQPGKRRGFLATIGRILFLLFAVATALLFGIAGGHYLDFEQTVVDINQSSKRNPQLVKAAKKLDLQLPGRPAIALVIGTDLRRFAKGDERGGMRSDTVMLMRADPEQGTLSMLSMPRDLLVDIYCPGRTPFRGPINSAFGTCGPEGTVQTVKHLTGLPIHYLVTVDFRGFIQLVDKLDGVWLDVDRRYFNDNSGGGPTFPPATT